MSRSAFVRQAALTSTAGKVVDVARVRRNVDEGERHRALAPAAKPLAETAIIASQSPIGTPLISAGASLASAFAQCCGKSGDGGGVGVSGWCGVADDKCGWLLVFGLMVAAEAVECEVATGGAGDDLVLAVGGG